MEDACMRSLGGGPACKPTFGKPEYQRKALRSFSFLLLRREVVLASVSA
jgi:hypothetical protein